MDGALCEQTWSSLNVTFDPSASCLMSGSENLGLRRVKCRLNAYLVCAEPDQIFGVLSSSSQERAVTSSALSQARADGSIFTPCWWACLEGGVRKSQRTKLPCGTTAPPPRSEASISGAAALPSFLLLAAVDQAAARLSSSPLLRLGLEVIRRLCKFSTSVVECITGRTWNVHGMNSPVAGTSYASLHHQHFDVWNLWFATTERPGANICSQQQLVVEPFTSAPKDSLGGLRGWNDAQLFKQCSGETWTV